MLSELKRSFNTNTMKEKFRAHRAHKQCTVLYRAIFGQSQILIHNDSVILTDLTHLCNLMNYSESI